MRGFRNKEIRMCEHYQKKIRKRKEKKDWVVVAG